jgi:hypothetical protein
MGIIEIESTITTAPEAQELSGRAAVASINDAMVALSKTFTAELKKL